MTHMHSVFISDSVGYFNRQFNRVLLNRSVLESRAHAAAQAHSLDVKAMPPVQEQEKRKSVLFHLGEDIWAHSGITVN